MAAEWARLESERRWAHVAVYATHAGDPLPEFPVAPGCLLLLQLMSHQEACVVAVHLLQVLAPPLFLPGLSLDPQQLLRLVRGISVFSRLVVLNCHPVRQSWHG